MYLPLRLSLNLQLCEHWAVTLLHPNTTIPVVFTSEINFVIFLCPLQRWQSAGSLKGKELVCHMADRINWLRKSEIMTTGRPRWWCFSSHLAVVFVQSIATKCKVKNDDVVGAAPTGDAPTTPEWSTSLWPPKLSFILDGWRYYVYMIFGERLKLEKRLQCSYPFPNFNGCTEVWEWMSN